MSRGNSVELIAVSLNNRSGLVETLCSIVIPPATLPGCRLSYQ
jgi:hypothetical protein